MRWQHYYMMGSLPETLERLAAGGGLARVVAGGTDLLTQIRAMAAEEEHLVLLDVSALPEMRGIREADGHLQIGAAATMSELAASPEVRGAARALAQGAGWMGSPQIRNVATVGGNVVNAMPAGDASVPLMALGATALIASPEGEREIPLERLFLGIGQSQVNPSREVLTRFRLPCCRGPRKASAMQRMSRRKVFTLPQLSVAVRIELSPQAEAIEEARIVVGPVSERPWRAQRAEAALCKAEISNEPIRRAAALARQDAAPRDSLRGGAEYRREMVEVLVRRALLDALSQLGREIHG